ncbi:YdgH/BhsA/McbA family protein [Klebsiella aerogenes]|uniref:DUF1471 domain-containing protein n=1 Tax=Klebsiella aerogenes TaxID=548 RepID=UPI001F3BBBBE|nr:DUF1471 domain-containing protein [Klebsiella aerogenes]
MRKIIIFTALMSFSFASFAATELHDSEMASMKSKIGSISVKVKNGTYAEAMSKLSSEADKKHASYYRVTSMGRLGMGSDVSATAEIYE